MLTLAWWQLLLMIAAAILATGVLAWLALVWVWTDGFRNFGPG